MSAAVSPMDAVRQVAQLGVAVACVEAQALGMALSLPAEDVDAILARTLRDALCGRAVRGPDEWPEGAFTLASELRIQMPVLEALARVRAQMEDLGMERGLAG